jgi:glutamine synthetase
MLAEYIWIDGGDPTSRVRSKTRVLGNLTNKDPNKLPMWSFDGSSTNQAEGSLSDCQLKPIKVIPDPIRGGAHILVLCEVMDSEGNPHPSNKRALLREALEGFKDQSEWVAFEQEYTLYQGSRPLGFPSERRFPPAQGPYYCGVGADEVAGRAMVEKHLELCLEAGLPLTGINAEVMPGQWEFQIGGPKVGVLEASDYLWLARWLLYRVGEDFNISATLDPKPVPGDWNGAGMHTNFSTKEMRQEGGLRAIEEALVLISKRVPEHLERYGAGYEVRLTGKHETCRYDEFKWGVSDRTASVRIPLETSKNECGYFEDRRPNANADPYLVCEALVKTISRQW